ncbi:unnamed protein product [Closterium sp. NIES-53]
MLALCREQRLEHRTKHIALRYFLARELQQRGQLRLAYVASEANTADVFTKALAPSCSALLYLTGLVTPCSPPLCLWGEALAAKAAAEAIATFNMVDDVIRAVAEYLGRSSPWHQRFMELQEVFTSTNLEVQGIHELDYPLVHAQILRTTPLLESQYIDYGDDFGGGPNEQLYRFIEKHGPKGSPEMVVEGASSDGSLNRFKATLHERRVAKYIGPSHHDACVVICADMAKLLIQQLQSKLGDLDSLSGIDKKRAVKELRTLCPVLARAPKSEPRAALLLPTLLRAALLAGALLPARRLAGSRTAARIAMPATPCCGPPYWPAPCCPYSPAAHAALLLPALLANALLPARHPAGSRTAARPVVRHPTSRSPALPWLRTTLP